MDINFPLILLLLVSAGALIWIVDILWLRDKRPNDAKEPLLVENARQLTPILALVFFFRSFLFEPFQIPSASMVPTLLIGDFILVNKYTYGIRLPVWRKKVFDVSDPQQGDIMVFFPPHKDQYFIKRVIGVPGDRIEVRNKDVYVNGERLPTDITVDLPNYQDLTESIEGRAYQVRKYKVRDQYGDQSFTVPAGHYFMMGDNRDNSYDSRGWSFVPEGNIVGKAFAKWMHWDDFWSLPSFSRVGRIE